MFFQFGVIGFFIPHASEIDAVIGRLDEVVGMGEAIPLHLLPHLLQELVVDRLQESVMHLPEEILIPMLELYIREGLFCTVFETFHEEDFNLHQR